MATIEHDNVTSNEIWFEKNDLKVSYEEKTWRVRTFIDDITST